MNKRYILKDNKGAALIIAMLIMVVLIILGVAAIMTSSIETKISGNIKASKKAFYAAEAGLERFKAEKLRNNSNWSTVTDIPTTGLGDGSNYTVTVIDCTLDTVTVQSRGTFGSSTTTIEAHFDKNSVNKVLIADKNINIGRDSD